jgi:hypothetical protein
MTTPMIVERKSSVYRNKLFFKPKKKNPNTWLDPGGSFEKKLKNGRNTLKGFDGFFHGKWRCIDYFSF